MALITSADGVETMRKAAVMSGVEVVGLLLGAFPLCISAMEHYEDTRKVAGTFFKIRRVHKRDFGKVKDCQLMFRLNLKELLMPLLKDEVVDQVQYEQLLACPGSSDWGVENVESALEERLGECHKRYTEILEEMQETMAALCEACRVDDDQFQQHLKQQQKKPMTSSAAQQAQYELLSNANSYVVFQAKRVKYAFGGTKREDLLADLESQNNKVRPDTKAWEANILIRRMHVQLREVLSASDRVSALSQTRRRTHQSSINPRALKFWRHADNIYNILRTTWTCACRSCASLWLQQKTGRLVQMSVALPFCHGRRTLNIEWTEAPLSIQLTAPRQNKNTRPTAMQSMSLQPAPSSRAVLPMRGHSARVTTCTQTILTMQQAAPAQSPSPPATVSLQQVGICAKLAANGAGHVCLGKVVEGDNEYAIYPAVERVSFSSATALADLLRPDAAPKLTRVQRYGVALTLASSHLQLHSTPWLKTQWTSEDVLFPTNDNSGAFTLHEEPYILAHMSPATTTFPISQKDRSFSTLGIVLLELCFGRRLEEHPMWQTPGYAALKHDPIMRQTMACEWLDDVPGEAGEDYANAVEWTLKQSPAVLKDDKWRADFAQNVVQPLQRYYEYLHPNS